MIQLTWAQAHLQYDEPTGRLFWKIAPSNVIKVGQQAGSLNTDGYRQIKIAGRIYQAHYLVWLLHTGIWPTHELDHEDGNRDNNRYDNLRPATHAQNCRYRKKRSDNTSGFKGVSLKPNGKFLARIFVSGRNVNLGSFIDPKDAAVAYDNAAISSFGSFAMTNKSMGLL